jgi:cytochrome c oxidase subunit 3/cytochrome o ubiquinol oxidase subunit 3
VEWRGLIGTQGLTIATNLFGTTFYTLVGFHAFHVVVGLLALGTVLVLGVLGRLQPRRDLIRFELVSWYWHFVDVVWIFVFTTVYIVGMRS